jgi:trigger factor
VPDYEGLEVSVEDLEVTDEDVEEQLRSLRERFATLHEVDRPAADRDFVVIDLLARKDGEPVEGAEVSGMSYQVGTEGLVDGIDEALLGMSAGEEKTFTSRLVGGDQMGNEVDVEVKVSAVKEQDLPELDDEFAQTASEFDTVEELRADIRTRLERGKRLEQAASARDAVLERLLELVEIPLPDAMVEAEINARRENVEQQLEYAGISMQSYLDSEEMTIDEFEADLEKRVRDAVAAQFLLEEVARKTEIGVDQQELTDHIFRRAQQSGQDPNEFARHMVEHNHIPEMVSEVVRGKALAGIVEAAKVSDASGNEVDLKNLLPDGSLAEPGQEEAGAEEAQEGATGEAAEQEQSTS